MNYNKAHNKSSNLDETTDSDFTKIVDAVLSRRNFLGTTCSIAAFFATSALAQAVKAASMSQSKLLGFTAIKANTADTITLPPGYKFEVLMS